MRTLRSFLRHLGPLLRPYWRRELEVLAYMVFEMAYGVALPLATRQLVDGVIPSGRVDGLVVFVLGLLGLYIANAVVGVRRAYVTSWINDGIRNELEARVFAHLQRLPHAFYARAKVGDIMARLSGDLEVVELALAQVAGVGVFLVLRALAAGVAVLLLDPGLGALMLVVIPAFGVSYAGLRSRLQAASLELQQLTGESAAVAQENLAAHDVIKAFGLEERAIAEYAARLRRRLQVGLRLTIFGALFEASMMLAVTLGELLVLGVGGYLVMRGELTVGTLLAFIGLLPWLLQPVMMLSNVGHVLQRASGALERVTEVLDEPVNIADRPGAAPVAPLAGEIRFEQVSFGYEQDRPVIADLDLVIPAGTHVSVVGLSGSGKTTLVNLLLRFWDPEAGRIAFDGHDLRDVTLASLRGQIGVVFQDTAIFDTSLGENIGLGRLGATESEIAAAAGAAQLGSYVASLPQGYATLVGERGVRMSGGQRQRVALARALLRDPRLLILDEATSALDAQTEREILDTLVEVGRGRTIVSVTHRLSLAASADHIVVVDHGRIVEQGTHADLVRRHGVYRRLYEEQTGYAIARAEGA
jgi:ABC-type multidrug transport system fused ATPase/permease subunit